MVNVALMQNATRYLVMIGGSIILLLALIGNGLIIFLFGCRSGKFGKSPGSLYFTAMGIIKTILLIDNLVYLIMSIGFGIDPTLTSVVYCKLRYYIAHATLPPISLTLECAATISQFLATSRQASYREKNTHKAARICICLTICFWSLQAIPYLILFKIKIDPVTNKTICDSFNTGLNHYKTWILRIMTILILPFTILPVFGCLTLRNIRHLGSDSDQQQQIERQMSMMLLVQIAFYIIGCIPFGAWSVYILITATFKKNLERKAIENPVYTIVYLLITCTFANSFYLFYATSEPFRKQCKATFQAIFGCLRQFQEAQTSLVATIDKQTVSHEKDQNN